MACTPIHPGEILADELQEIGLSAKKLADVIEVPPNRPVSGSGGEARNGGYGSAAGSAFRHVG
jgi:hypothetical protein